MYFLDPYLPIPEYIGENSDLVNCLLTEEIERIPQKIDPVIPGTDSEALNLIYKEMRPFLSILSFGTINPPPFEGIGFLKVKRQAKDINSLKQKALYVKESDIPFKNRPWHLTKPVDYAVAHKFPNGFKIWIKPVELAINSETLGILKKINDFDFHVAKKIMSWSVEVKKQIPYYCEKKIRFLFQMLEGKKENATAFFLYDSALPVEAYDVTIEKESYSKSPMPIIHFKWGGVKFKLFKRSGKIYERYIKKGGGISWREVTFAKEPNPESAPTEKQWLKLRGYSLIIKWKYGNTFQKWLTELFPTIKGIKLKHLNKAQADMVIKKLNVIRLRQQTNY